MSQIPRKFQELKATNANYLDLAEIEAKKWDAEAAEAPTYVDAELCEKNAKMWRECIEDDISAQHVTPLE